MPLFVWIGTAKQEVNDPVVVNHSRILYSFAFILLVLNRTGVMRKNSQYSFKPSLSCGRAKNIIQFFLEERFKNGYIVPDLSQSVNQPFGLSVYSF